MPLKLTQSVAPTDEPVTRDEARLWARITITDENAVIDNLIVTARDWAESLTRRQFVTATWERELDGFPPDGAAIVLPRPPLSSITSIGYTDENGDAQTWSSANYQVDTSAEPGCVLPVEGETYPSTQAGTLNTVTVTYQAGYGDPADVPQQIKTAILLYVQYLYDRPGDPALKDAADRLLRRKYQVGAF
jgi:uncharacterized phiE125 gp8 family phage protein